MKTLREQIADKCRHFTGLQKDACSAGVRYDSVRDASHPGPYRWPCFKSRGASKPCVLADWLSAEEVERDALQSEHVIHEALVALDKGLCPVCGKSAEPRQQIGRCVYGNCGHRLYQGRL